MLPEKPLEQARDTGGSKYYSIRTEHSCISWIKRYIVFHHKRHPKEMGAHEIEEFLTHLAVNLKIASSTQNQAFNAVRAKRPERLPTVMSKGLILIRHVDGAVGNRVDLRIPGQRHEELISHGQPLVVRY